MTAKRIAALMKPASVVLVGASDTPGTLGDVVRRNLPCEGTLAKQRAVVGQAVVRDVGARAPPAQQ